MSSKAGGSQGGWQVKRVNSITGPFVGTDMSDAIDQWNTNVTGQTTMIWSGPDSQFGTTSSCKLFRFTLKPKFF